MQNIDKEKIAEIVIGNFNGIIPYFEAFYIQSIIYSAGRCLEAFDRYENYKKQEISPDYLVSTIQEAVGHAAALSRYFWPSPQGSKKEPNQKKLKEARGIKLREAFGLDETSPLYNRTLRNAWEHFDERLDSYLLGNEAGNFFPSCIIDSHSLADDPVGHVFKLLDPDAACLVLMGNKYFFSPIREEVDSILKKANESEKNGARLKTKTTVL